MRRIIDGIAYDTDLAEMVARGSHGEDVPSDAWWQLFRTPTGAWFEVAADHDGVPAYWNALSSSQARDWLERHANHLVERYFGRMPDLQPVDAGSGVTEVTRRRVFDTIALQKINWSGRLTEDEFLGRLFNLDELPSNDPRYKTMRRDIWQHRVNNPEDWDDDWVFKDRRLDLLHAPDDIFLRFLAEMVHPMVRSEEGEAAELIELMNTYLVKDGFRLAVVETISGRSVYAAARLLAPVAGLDDARRVGLELGNYVAAQVTRMQTSLAHDPAVAIGTAKEFVETICKGIIEARGATWTATDTFPALATRTRDLLDLKVDRKADTTLKSLLGALGTIVNSIAELRGSLGTGHGAAPSSTAPSIEVARLAVGVATSLGVFLWERHNATSAPLSRRP